MRYIHHNPEKAGICPRQKYQWSSYRFYMDESPTLLEIKEILKVFSKNTGLARQQFREFDKEVGEEGFLEIKAVPVTGINEENVEQFITRFLTENGMTREELLKNQEQTIRLVGQIKNNSSLSLRKIAIAIGINRETVRKLSQEPSR
jgi:DNA-directed RNA polymerase sigma subunit (sigma70/sigma32)